MKPHLDSLRRAIERAAWGVAQGNAVAADTTLLQPQLSSADPAQARLKPDASEAELRALVSAIRFLGRRQSSKTSI